MIAELIAAAVGTVAFALLFGVPRRYYFTCAWIGAVDWLVYKLLLPYFADASFPVFFATAVAILCSRFMAVRRRCPATVFMITGIFPLVPGAQIYWAAYYLVTNQFDQALASGFAAIKAIVAIVLGIIFVFELPNRFFRLAGGKSGKNAAKS